MSDVVETNREVDRVSKDRKQRAAEGGTTEAKDGGGPGGTVRERIILRAK